MFVFILVCDFIIFIIMHAFEYYKYQEETHIKGILLFLAGEVCSNRVLIN